MICSQCANAADYEKQTGKRSFLHCTNKNSCDCQHKPIKKEKSK